MRTFTRCHEPNIHIQVGCRMVWGRGNLINMCYRRVWGVWWEVCASWWNGWLVGSKEGGWALEGVL
jgi:hypothetical protein